MQRKARPGDPGSVRLEFLGIVLLGRRVDRAALRAGVIAAREAAFLAVVAKLRLQLRLRVEQGVHGGLVQVALARLPIVDLLLGLVLADTVGILDLADQLVALAGDLVEVVVGELAPLLLHFALHLLPVSSDAVPVHVGPFSVTLPLYGSARFRYAAEGRRRAWSKAREEPAYTFCASAIIAGCIPPPSASA